MNIAAFEDEPQADAAARRLRELGIDAEVMKFSDREYDDRVRDFIEGRTHQYEAHAFVASDGDHKLFVRIIRHYSGQMVQQDSIKPKASSTEA